jgi:hypothetical protein
MCCAVVSAAVLLMRDSTAFDVVLSLYVLMGAPMALHWAFN